jgi:hypothetical protein
MRIPFLTRLLEIKEEQLAMEKDQIDLLISLNMKLFRTMENLNILEPRLTKLERRCKNGK